MPKACAYVLAKPHFCPTSIKAKIYLGLEKRFFFRKFAKLMTIQEAQQKVDEWIRTYGVRYFSPLTNMAQLTEEVGEVARIISRTYGEQSFKPSDKGKDLGDELADVLWVVLCLANQTGVDLTAALERNFDKKTNRDAFRHLNNEKLSK